MAQSNIGKTCPYCQYPLKADAEAVECPSCKVPHHKECWEQNGGCTTFGCREKSYQPVAGAERLEISFDEPTGRDSAPARGGGVVKLLAAALVITLLAFAWLLSAHINMLNNRTSVLPNDTADVPAQTYDPVVIAGLDVDYYIDYTGGTIPLGDLPIGARVVDPSWEWEYRLGDNYSDNLYGIPSPQGEVKPVTWLVVAKDHYEGLDPHVTLLAEELIGRFPFDNSTDRDHKRAEFGYGHWGESGMGNATLGLRPWLNSTGIHSGEGFYWTFSDSFKQAVLTTTVPNKEWQNGSAYSTSDHVFVPSTTELGDTEHDYTYPTGTTYAYFQGAGDAKRIARLGGDAELYWTRSSASIGDNVKLVKDTSGFWSYLAFYGRYAVRPALNLKSEILVSEINP